MGALDDWIWGEAVNQGEVSAVETPSSRPNEDSRRVSTYGGP